MNELQVSMWLLTEHWGCVDNLAWTVGMLVWLGGV